MKTLHQRPVGLFVHKDGTEEVVYIHSWPPPSRYEKAKCTSMTTNPVFEDPVHLEFSAVLFRLQPGVVSSHHEFLIDGAPQLAPVYMEQP
jgi:hypothetical protein